MQKAPKKPKPFMPWFIMDFRRDTGHLTLEECECYRRLLEEQWNRDAEELPNDDAVLARLLRMELETWKRLRPVMEPFYDLTPGHWSHPRLVEVWLWASAQMQAEHDARSAGARVTNAKRAAKRHAQRHGERPQLQLQSHSQSQSSSQVTEISKAILNEGNVVRNALEVPDEEEFLRRTRDLVGAEEMAGQRFFFWRKLLRDHPRAYTDALVDAESRKKGGCPGSP